eukprot:s1030_g7.t1
MLPFQHGSCLPRHNATKDVEHLLTDTSGSKPFLHLPLTNVAAASKDEAGWMMLREDGKEIPAEELQNLWLEHRITLRVEFLEVPQSRRLLAEKVRRVRPRFCGGSPMFQTMGCTWQ